MYILELKKLKGNNMPKFEIEIIETLTRVIKVEAKNKEDAIDIVKRQYHDEKIVLDANDFVDVHFLEITSEK